MPCAKELDVWVPKTDRHLDWVLAEYVEHYNIARPHRSEGELFRVTEGSPATNLRVHIQPLPRTSGALGSDELVCGPGL